MNTLFTAKSLKKKWKYLARQCAAIAIILLLIFNQTVSPVFAQFPTAVNFQTQEDQPVKEAADAPAPAVVAHPAVQTSIDFLREDSPLKPVTDSDTQKSHKNELAPPKTDMGPEMRDYSEFSFEDAVSELSKDYASAIIVKNLSGEDLKKLVELDLEVGIAVLKGKTVLFTTGNQDEIRANLVARELLDQADLLAHTHPAGHRLEASLSDFELAGSKVEYVVSEAGVYAYNHDGLVQDAPYDDAYLAGKINALQHQNTTGAETRDLLNQFILAMDEYNQDKSGYDLFRSDDPITVYPNKPVISTFASQPPSQPLGTISVTQESTSVFTANYNVTNNGSYVGSYLDFGTNYADMSSSSITKFTFGMITNNICTSSSCVKVEFMDSAYHVAAVLISGLTTNNNSASTAFEQVSINKSTLLSVNSSLDFAHIKQINFVIDHGIAVNKPAGFLKIKTGGLFFQPSLQPDATSPAVTTLPATSWGDLPVLTSFASQDGSSVQVAMSSETNAAINLTLVGTGSYGGAYINYDNTSTSSTVETANLLSMFQSGMVLQLDNNATGVGTVKFEVTDINNAKATALLVGVDSVTRRWKIKNTDLDGIDLSQVKTIALVIEGQYPTGEINLSWGRFSYTPVIAGTSYIQGNLTSLPNTPILGTGKGSAGGSANGTITQTQTSPRDFSFNYTLADSDDFVFSQAGWGYFDGSNVFQGTAQNLSGGLVVAVNGASGKSLKVEVLDKSGKVADFLLTLTGTKQNYSLLFSSDNIPVGFDATQIALINFVSDLSHMGSSGTVTIETKGLDYQPVITGTSYIQGNLTSLPNTPILGTGKGSAGGSANGTITQTQTSPRDFSFNYTLADSDDFVFSQAGWGYFDGSNVFQGTAQNLSGGLVVAVNGASGKSLKVEVLDKSGKVADFLLTLTGTKQNYSLLFSSDNIPVGFDATQIALINFVSDLSHMGSSGTVTIETKGLDYQPVITGTSYIQGNLTSLPNTPILGTGKGSAGGSANGTITQTQTSPRDFSFNYTLADSDDFVFSQAGWGYFDGSNVFQGTAQNLSGGLVVAVNGASGKSLKVEVLDKSGKVADFLLTLTGTKQNYSLLFSSDNIPVGFDATQIALINFVSDLSHMGSSGTVTIETKGLDYQPVITGTSYIQGNLTSLPNTPILGTGKGSAGGSANGTITQTQTSPRDFSFNYTLADSDDFVFSQAGWGYFDGSNVFQGTAQNLSGGLVVAVNGASGKSLKVEVLDKSGKVADFLLTLTGTKQNYSLLFSSDNIPVGFDATQIALINFVSDLSHMGSSGTVTIETKGLDYQPVITGTSYIQGNLTSLPNTPILGTGKGSAGGSANGTITQTQTSPRDFSFNYTLADSDDFVFSQAGWGYFDGSNVFQGTAQNLSGGLVVAVNGASGKSLKVEVLDKSGKVADFLLTLTGTKQNYSLLFSSDNIPVGFDATQIALINFVSDLSHMGSSGTVTIETKGLDYQPVITGTSYIQGNLTSLPNTPILGTGKGSAGGSANGTITQTQTSPRDFSFNYTLADSDDFVFSQAGWGYFDGSNVFQGTAQNLSGGLVVAVNGASGKSLKVEVLDKAGKVADFLLTLTGSKQNYTLLFSSDNIPVGFDATQIALINFVSDLSHMGASGTVVIETKGLDYQPVITGTSYIQGNLTSLPNTPILGTGKGSAGGTANGTITQTQTSPRDFSFNYTLADSDDFVFSQIGWGYFDGSNVFQGTAQNLSSGLVVAVNGPSGKSLKVEVVDKAGKVADFLLTLTGTKQNYSLLFSSDNIPVGFDATQIALINFVSDLSHMGASGTVVIETKGLDYQPVITGTSYIQGNLTTLPNTPILGTGKGSAGGSANGTITQTQTSPRDFSFNYTLADSDDFVFSQIGWGYFDGSNVFQGTAQNLSSGLVVAVNGPSGKSLKVEVVDKAGKVADFLLTLTGTKQNYSLLFSSDNIPVGFDATQIALINFVSDLSHMGASGTVVIETKGLDYQPVITGTSYIQGNLTTLPNTPILGTGKGSAGGTANGTITQTQTSPRDFSFNYTLADSDDFVFSQIGWGYFDGSNVFQGTAQNLSSGLVVAVNGPSGKSLKVEVLDKAGKVADFLLTLTGTKQNYSLLFSSDNIPVGFDATQIALINFVSDLSHMGASGTVVIETKGLDYQPVITGTSYIQGNLTSLPNTPILGTGKGSAGGTANGTITQTQTSPRDFSFNYTLADSDDFVFSQIGWGYFDGSNVFQGTAQNLSSGLVVAVNGPSGKSLKVEVVDKAGKVADFLLTLTGTKQNYSLLFSSDNIPVGFDATQIALINFVSDLSHMGASGTVVIETKGLDYQPVITGTSYIQGNLTTLPNTPILGTGKGSAGGTANGTITQTQTSPRDFSFNYTLADSDDFVFSQAGWGYFDGSNVFQGTAQNLSGGLVVAVNGASGKSLKVEVVDKAGKVADFLLTLTGTKQNYSLLFSSDNIPVGFDATQIALINFVSDLSHMGASGTVVIETKGLDYQPVITGTSYIQGNLTSLPNTPILGTGKGSAGGSANGTITQTQTSPRDFSFNYTLADSDDFVFSQAGWGYFDGSNVFQGTAQNLSSGLVVAVNGPSGKSLKVEVVDKAGKVADFLLTLTGTKQNYSLLFSSDNIPVGFDATQIALINFVSDLSHMGASGTVVIETKGLDYQPVITGTSYIQGNLTTLPNTPILGTGKGSAGGTANGTITQTQTSPRDFSFNYTLADSDDFVFSQIGWGYFDGSNVFQGTAQNLSSGLVVAVNGPSGKSLKVEVVDKAGKVADFLLTLTGTKQNYSLLFSSDNIPVGFDATQIALINFVSDLSHMGASGTVVIETKGLDYQPVITGTSYIQGNLTSLPNTPILGTGKGSAGGTANGTITQTQTSPRDFSFNYTLADSDDFVFSQIGWGYFDGSNVFQGTAQNLSSGLVVAVNGPSGKSLKVEVVDKAGKVADFLLTLTGTKQNYSLLFSSDNIPVGFDATQIALINFVSDLSHMGASGTVVIETKGLDYQPVITGTSYIQGNLTSLPNTPILGTGKGSAGGSANGTITQTQTSPRDFSFNYTLADSDDFVFSQAGWGYFDGSNVFQGTAQNLSGGLVVAVNGASGKSLKVEVLDKSGKVADFLLTLTGTKQNYSLLFSSDNIPVGFDATQIALINFVSDLSHMGASGTVVIETKGLDYQPVITGTSYIQGNLTTLPNTPILGTGKGSAGGSANGTITQTQTSPRDFSFNYTLADSDDFVFSQVVFQGSAQNLSSGLVVAVNGPSGKSLKVEVLDKAGKVADFLLTLTGSKQNYTLLFSSDNIPVGFDATQIALINFVSDLSHMGASGTVVIETKGLDYQPVITGTSYIQGNLTTLPNTPILGTGKGSAGGSANGTITQTQTSPRDFSFNYTLADSDDFVFSQAGWGYFDGSNVFQGTAQNLSGGLVVAVNGASGKSLKVEVLDKSGKVADFLLTLTGTKQNYSLLFSSDNIPVGFDATQIALINFVSDLSHMGASGTVTIETKGLFFIPTITPDLTNPNVVTVPLTSTGERPVLTGFASQTWIDPNNPVQNYSVSGSVTVASNAVLDLGFGSNSLFADGGGLSISGTLILGSGGVNGLANKIHCSNSALPCNVSVDFNAYTTVSGDQFLINGVAVTAPLTVTYNFKNSSGQTLFTKTLTYSSDSQQNVAFDMPVLSGITSVQFVVQGSGSFSFNAPGLQHPFIQTDASQTTVVMNSPRTATLNFNLLHASSFGGVFISYDNYATPGKESINLNTAFSSGLVIGLNDGNTGVSSATLEITDTNGNKSSVLLTGITSTDQRWKVLPSQFFGGADLTIIQSIALVETGVALGKKLNITWGDFAYTPIITGTTYSQGALTSLPNTPILGTGKGSAGGSANGTITQTQTSPRDFSFNYTLADSDDFVFSQIGWGYFDGSNVFQGTAQNLSGGLVVAVNGPSGKSLKVEVMDKSGKVADYLLMLTGTKQNYTLLFSSDNIPVGFDATQIALINFVSDLSHMGASGTVTIETKGLFFIPTITPDLTNPNVVTVPLTSTGERPVLTGFASQTWIDPSNPVQEYPVSGSLTVAGNTVFNLGFGSESLLASGGGLTISGMVILGSGGANGLGNEMQCWNSVLPCDVSVDFSAQSIVNGDQFLVHGVAITAPLSMTYNFKNSAGQILFTKTLTYSSDSQQDIAWSMPDLAGITTVQIVLQGSGSFSFNAPKFQHPFVQADDSQTTVAMSSPRSATVNFNLLHESSFGGVFFDYDNAQTPAKESIDLNEAFPSGLVLGLNDGNIGLGSAKLEITDINGNRSSVLLTGINSADQRWKILPGQFFGSADLSVIQTIALVVTGVAGGKTLHMTWGDFAYTPVIGGTPYSQAALTSLPNNPVLATGKGSAGGDINGTITQTQTSPRDFSFNYTLADSDDFVFSQIGWGYFDITDTFHGNVQNLSSGLVMAAAGPAGTQIKVEVMDKNAKIANFLVPLTGIKLDYTLLFTSDNVPPGFDATQIALINFVSDLSRMGSSGTVTIETKGLDYVPSVLPVTNPSAYTVSALPPDANGNYLSLNGLASFNPQGLTDPSNPNSTKNPALADWSNASVTMTSKASAVVNMNLYNTYSFGGVYASYDDPGTAGVDKVINLDALYSGGLVIGLNNMGTDITQASLEVTDVNGRKQSVTLDGIGNTLKKWNIATGLFDLVDRTQIKTMSVVAKGRHVGGQLEVDLGDFEHTPTVTPVTNPAAYTISTLPKDVNGNYLALNSLASSDWSNASVTMTSKASAVVNMNLYNTYSFGGVYASYDDPGTAGVDKVINLDALYSGGLVIGLNNMGTDITQASLEVTDVNGRKQSVTLDGIGNTLKKWNIATGLFDLVDRTQIKTMSVVAKGRHVGGQLEVDLGDFEHTPTVTPVTNPAAYTISTLPKDVNGNYLALNSLASSDWSNAAVTMTSKASAVVNMNLYNTYSFGGVYASYDDPGTAGVDKVINLDALYSGGLVIGLNNMGTDITQASLEVTDVNGRKQSVTLDGIGNTLKKWNIATGLFDLVDRTQIKTMSVVAKGRHVGGQLEVDLGDFEHTPTVTPVTNPAAYTISTLPKDVNGNYLSLNRVASFNPQGLTDPSNPASTKNPALIDWSNTAVTMTSKSSAIVDMNLYNTFSFGGVYASYDDPSTAGVDKVINLDALYSGGLVIGLNNMGTDITQASLEVTDINNHKQSVTLDGIQNFLKKWNISVGAFDLVDRTQIKMLTVVVKGRHVGGQLEVDLGDFAYTPVVLP